MRCAAPVTDLSALRAIPEARARLDAEELELIDRARRGGATWADIALALDLGTRQAAEQRRSRLARSRQQTIDGRYGVKIATLRTAADDLDRRVTADRRWDGRFPRAALVRETLEAARQAVPGSLFSLVKDVVEDLDSSGVELPAPLGKSTDRLREAFTEAVPAS